jgi:uncharacterized protein (DUF58 family)
MNSLIRIWKKYIGDLYLRPRWYTLLSFCAAFFLLRFFLPVLGRLPFVITALVLITGLFDWVALFLNSKAVHAVRSHADRFSNGDENSIQIEAQNFYHFPVKLELIDEIPFTFQRRDILFRMSLAARGSGSHQYILRPVKRGDYEFGHLNIYVSSWLGLIQRRFRFEAPEMVPVYPSYQQMRKYQLLAINDRLSEVGIKKIRRIGHSMEFEQIKEYVHGDDYRTVNWKATARRSQLMVNHFVDEKSQQIYCVIDKGRLMKMPFEGMSLLDYAINASLVLTNVALFKQDRAGIITFSEQPGDLLIADKKPTQMQAALHFLYNQKTRWLESDFERLYSLITTRIKQRSLLILFSNFESMSGLQRQIPALRKLAKNHLLLVVFFENTELIELVGKEANHIEAIYIKTIAEKFAYEKRLILKELQKYGVTAVLTTPAELTVNTVNKYLELKAKMAI